MSLNDTGDMSVTALIIAMGIFALIGSFTPGPVNILAVRHGSDEKPSVGVAYVLGASLSYTLIVWLMGKGGEQLLNHQLFIQTMKWAGAIYLMYIAWRIASAPFNKLHKSGVLARNNTVRAFVDGGITQSINPKAWMVALSGVLLFVLPQTDAQAALSLFCIVSLLACICGVGCWALAGRHLTRWLAAPSQQKFFNQAMGVLLACSVINMVR